MCLADEIVRQNNIESVAWLLLAALTQIYIEKEQRQRRYEA